MTFLSSQHHSFDVRLARAFGMDGAVLIHHFQHWIRINRFAKRNIKDGRCWTYQTRREIQAHFPYLSFDEVRRTCEKLIALGVLVTGNYNKSKVDKTLWYAFVDEQAFGVDEENSNKFYERQNCPSKGKSAFPEGKSATPIPDTKPNAKPEEKEKEKENIQKKDAPFANAQALADFFLVKLREKKPDFSKGLTPSWIKSCEKLLKARSRPDLEKLIAFGFEHEFWFKNILSPDKLLKHLDALELEMSKVQKSPAQKQLSDKELAEKIRKKYRGHPEIIFGENHIEFNFGPMNRPYLKFGDSGFREQLLNYLDKMRLSIEGL